jgi:hypothetical protein
VIVKDDQVENGTKQVLLCKKQVPAMVLDFGLRSALRRSTPGHLFVLWFSFTGAVRQYENNYRWLQLSNGKQTRHRELGINRIDLLFSSLATGKLWR